MAFHYPGSHEECRDVHIGLAECAVIKPIASVVCRENDQCVLHHACLGQAVKNMANVAVNILQTKTMF